MKTWLSFDCRATLPGTPISLYGFWFSGQLSQIKDAEFPSYWSTITKLIQAKMAFNGSALKHAIGIIRMISHDAP